MKNRVAFVFFAAVLAGSPQNKPGISTEIRPAAWLHGAVLDQHGSMIPGIKVSVASDKATCETMSNEEGKFNCQLFAGTYSVAASGVSILLYRRGVIQLKSGEHKFIYIQPVFRAPSDQMWIPDPSLKYQAYALAGENGPEVLIRFTASTDADREVVFRGPYVMLTFDAVAVYAGEVSCSKPIRTCIARGGVAVEVGEEQMSGTAVEVDVLHRRLTLSRDPTVTRVF